MCSHRQTWVEFCHSVHKWNIPHGANAVVQKIWIRPVECVKCRNDIHYPSVECRHCGDGTLPKVRHQLCKQCDCGKWRSMKTQPCECGNWIKFADAIAYDTKISRHGSASHGGYGDKRDGIAKPTAREHMENRFCNIFPADVKTKSKLNSLPQRVFDSVCRIFVADKRMDYYVYICYI